MTLVSRTHGMHWGETRWHTLGTPCSVGWSPPSGRAGACREAVWWWTPGLLEGAVLFVREAHQAAGVHGLLLLENVMRFREIEAVLTGPQHSVVVWMSSKH